MADKSTTNGGPEPGDDVEMKDESALDLQQPDPTDPNPPPQPENTSTPATNTEHLSTIQPGAALQTPFATTSNAHLPLPQQQQQTPPRPTSQPPQADTRPEKPVAHGGPTRQYLNAHVTPHLLEAMKQLAVEQPAKPLAWLSNFLKERSGEVEGA